MNHEGRKAVWLQRLIQEMGLSEPGSVRLVPLPFTRITSIDLASNPVGHGMSKHTQIQWFWGHCGEWRDEAAAVRDLSWKLDFRPRH